LMADSRYTIAADTAASIAQHPEYPCHLAC
jgi:hypothetical protein